MQLGDFLFDCKEVNKTAKQDGKTLRITAKMWETICYHAENEGRIPGWAGRMEGGIELIAIRRADFEALFDELAELRKKVENGALRTEKSKTKQRKQRDRGV